MSLLDDQPLDTKERSRIAKWMHTPGWFDGLPENTKRAVMSKLLASLREASTPRDIGTLARALIAAERNDIEREKMNVTQPAQHNHLHLHGEVGSMTTDELREYIEQRRAALAGRNGTGEPPTGGIKPV